MLLLSHPHAAADLAFGKPHYPCAPPSVVSAASVVKSPNLGSLACSCGLCPHPAILNSFPANYLRTLANWNFPPTAFLSIACALQRQNTRGGGPTIPISQLAPPPFRLCSLPPQILAAPLTPRRITSTLDMDTAPLSRHNLSGVCPRLPVGPLSQEGE